jgi:hypothetical protein
MMRPRSVENATRYGSVAHTIGNFTARASESFIKQELIPRNKRSPMATVYKSGALLQTNDKRIDHRPTSVDIERTGCDDDLRRHLANRARTQTTDGVLRKGRELHSMTFEEMAWDFVEVFEDLEVEQINEVLVKNVPFERLEFFNEYATDFGEAAQIGDAARKRLANLMLIGYLLRVLEERLLPDPSKHE